MFLIKQEKRNTCILTHRERTQAISNLLKSTFSDTASIFLILSHVLISSFLIVLFHFIKSEGMFNIFQEDEYFVYLLFLNIFLLVSIKLFGTTISI